MPKPLLNHNKLWKILKEMGVPDHLICLLRNLYVFLSGRSTSFWACRESAQYQQCVLCGTITHTTFSVWKGWLFQGVGSKAHKVRPCCRVCVCLVVCVCVCEMFVFLSGKWHIPSPSAGRLGLTERGFYLFCCVRLFLHSTHTHVHVRTLTHTIFFLPRQNLCVCFFSLVRIFSRELVSLLSEN